MSDPGICRHLGALKIDTFSPNSNCGFQIYICKSENQNPPMWGFKNECPSANIVFSHLPTHLLVVPMEAGIHPWTGEVLFLR
jgi:hypothetical protein